MNMTHSPSPLKLRLALLYRSLWLPAALLFLALLLGGCASAPKQQREALPQPDYSARQDVVADGAIFKQQGGLFWFQDRLAANPGDAITVVLQERTQAQKSATTSTAKDTAIGFEVPALGELTGQFNADTEISMGNSFEGSGDSSQSNSLSGQITVLVTERLPNGYLRVAGEKVLELNQGREYLRLTGIVRPEDIQPDNTVLSTRIAQADISYSGSGALAQANAQGWLARFFNSPLWPF